MGTMHRALVAATLVCSSFLALGDARPAAAAGGGVQHVPLVHNFLASCYSGLPRQLSDGYGVVAISTPGTGTLVVADVVLTHAQPNTTYRVALTQIPSGFGCNVNRVILTTNLEGDGSVHIAERVQPGTTGAFVGIVNVLTDDFYSTPAATLPFA